MTVLCGSCFFHLSLPVSSLGSAGPKSPVVSSHGMDVIL